jgi:hypothetical protein
MAEYSASNPIGIRRAPYDTYPNTYGSMNTGTRQVHNDGEIYGAIGWRMIQAYETAGLTRSDLLADLVFGMTFTPSRPRMELMRDGILQGLEASNHGGAPAWCGTPSPNTAWASAPPAPRTRAPRSRSSSRSTSRPSASSPSLELRPLHPEPPHDRLLHGVKRGGRLHFLPTPASERAGGAEDDRKDLGGGLGAEGHARP